MFQKLLSLALCGVLALGAALPRAARAQAYGSQFLISGGTNAVPGQTTNSYGAGYDIDVTRRNNLGLFLNFQAQSGTNISNVTFVFKHSLDQTTFTTTNLTRISLAGFGTNAVNFATNVTTGGIGYWRLDSIENLNGTAITNVIVQYSQKPPPY